MKGINFLIAGVGGQGTVLSGDILAQVGMEAGYDVKKSDVLGLAIRSGSVVSHVRWGDKINAPMSMPGQVDYLLAYEPLESLRMAEFLRPGGTILLNEYKIPPVAVATGGARYPTDEEIHRTLAAVARSVYTFNATAKAQELGSVKVVNVLMLGAISALVEIELRFWEESIGLYVPDKSKAVNLKAFHAGRTLL
jgi:indolepyruvate ferredoxin oxidoreductase beta subunit